MDSQRNNILASPRAGTPLRRHRTAARGGFTLLELLVALAISAALTIVLFESLQIANKARHSSERAVAPARTAQIALDLLRQDFENVPPAANAVDSSTAAILAPSFTGLQSSDDRGHEADIVDFFTLSEGQLRPPMNTGLGGQAVVGNGGLGGGTGGYGTNGDWIPAGETKQIEITIDTPNGSTDHCLVRKVWHNVQALNPNFDPTNPPVPDEEEVICRGVESFTVQYFDGSEWNDTWDSTQFGTNPIPAAVQITLEMDPPPGVDMGRNPQPKRYTQIIQLPCSNAVNDPSVNPEISGF